jgi:hypothetical protein
MGEAFLLVRDSHWQWLWLVKPVSFGYIMTARIYD